MKTNYFYRNFIHRTHLDQFWPHVLMLVGCALVTLLFVISYTHSTLNDQTVHMAKTNKEKIQRLDEMLILMLDAETSIRGFLVTHSEPYLVPFNNSLERYPKLITLMNKDFPEGSEDRAQFIHLKELIQQKFTHMVLALNKEGLVSPIPVGSSGRGKELMDDIRVTISVLKIKRTTANEVLEREAMARLGIIQSVIYLLAFGALFLILSLFYVQQRQSALRARIHQLLENRNTRLEALVEQRTFALTDLASHLTNAREEERQHLARELHDELGALLTVAKMDASGLLRTLGASAEQAIKDRFRRLIDSIGSAISLKRRIIDDLRPPLLQGLGLIEALRALTDQFNMDIPITVQLPTIEPELTDDQSLAVFRIAQESLTNIRKYAKAKKVSLELCVEQEDILLVIEDDGIGFSPTVIKQKGHGIAGMKHRTQMFNGKLNVRSSTNNGTRISARMPILK